MNSVVTTLAVLTNALKIAWSKETSSNIEWSPENPASGQCAITACLVQDYLGGEILHTTATIPDGRSISHYYNSLNGADVDLTKQQFPEGTMFTKPDKKLGAFQTTREYCLSYPYTKKRYEILKSRILQLTSNSSSI